MLFKILKFVFVCIFQSSKINVEGTREEYWAKGVGFGHENRPGWDMNAYIAAKAEKDNKVRECAFFS